MRVSARPTKKMVLALLAGAATVFAIAGPAMANPVTKVSATAGMEGFALASACHNNVVASGGNWQYGACSGTGVNYSYYHHGSRKHKSSVTNQKHGVKDSGCVNANTWAYASQPYDPNGNNQAFYSNDLCN
ncbi:lactococcin 972 family bacteriocin [Paractinoplanes rishiriensis]|uniref:Bacteriocin n=1 Tax=Paractinoplanes rishiriensis TaxID=1050105 RepID=A0A919MTQ5_9ACTN|nr:lactococcin 972 family bacteriocin [Actinoplanes rishiriensis]GIE99501.1 hypothetical protein Ari01nite_69660 [Actinoplanes rishiriensis]